VNIAEIDRGKVMNEPMKVNDRRIAVMDEEPRHAVVAVNPMQMLAQAVQQGLPIETLRELMTLKREWEADEARKAFNQAFAAFKAEAVVILKNTEIKDGPLKGKKHANLFDVVDAVTPHLSAHGLTISWKLTKDEKDWMEVTCTLRHVGGHSESVAMGSAPDAGPGRNTIQARGSAKSYLERYTATAILGLAAKDADDDGNGTGYFITEKQIHDLKALGEEVGVNKDKFLKFMKVDEIEKIPASQYAAAVSALEEKRKR
jgi:hypothetical protein